MIVSQYSAEFGADIGALVSDADQVWDDRCHGGVYEYLRNEWLDTDNHFTHTKPEDRQQMFGGTFGGPILRSRKLYFFTSQEGQLDSSLRAVLTVPTAAMKAGDFSGLSSNLRSVDDSLYELGMHSTTIPEQPNPYLRFDSVALNALKYFPEPTLPGIVNNLPASSAYKYT